MPRLFLLDQSLQNVGGHHFDYAFQSLRAADALGFDIVLAAHRRFDELSSVPDHWRVIAPFRHTTYGKHTIHVSSRSARGAARKQIADRLLFWLKPIRSAWRTADRNRRIRQFAAACHEVFAQTPPADGDIVFVPTLSEFDLLGLVSFLETHPASTKPTWHLQFHFNVFDGREPEYAGQAERAELVRRLMSQPLARVPNHQFYLYATCDPLARQFNLLDMGEFQSLSYPVDPAINVDSSRQGAFPLRLTCAGAIREEKGQQQLNDLVSTLGDNYFFAGKAKLVVQSNKSWFRLDEEKGTDAAEAEASPMNASRPDSSQLDNTAPPPKSGDIIQYVGHPLSPTEYASFIREADIGLLLYDSRRYYARRAGIMGEYLAAGTPVVVPAGCWLSEQLAESGFQYVDNLLATGDAKTSLIANQESVLVEPHADAQVANNDNESNNDEPARDADDDSQLAAQVSQEATNLIIRFHWTPDATPGEYVRVSLKELDESQRLLRTRNHVCGQRADNGRCAIMFRLHQLAHSVTLSMSNAYDQEPLSITDAELIELTSSSGEPLPASVVGVAFASNDDVPAAVAEIIDHFAHYRQSAIEFAGPWAQKHAPSRTIAQLVANSKGESSEA